MSHAATYRGSKSKFKETKEPEQSVLHDHTMRSSQIPSPSPHLAMTEKFALKLTLMIRKTDHHRYPHINNSLGTTSSES